MPDFQMKAWTYDRLETEFTVTAATKEEAERIAWERAEKIHDAAKWKFADLEDDDRLNVQFVEAL